MNSKLPPEKRLNQLNQRCDLPIEKNSTTGRLSDWSLVLHSDIYVIHEDMTLYDSDRNGKLRGD